MPTEVLLMADVPDLGAQGDIVKAADGYARNYLLPRKLAEAVTPAARARLAKLRERQEADRGAVLAQAQALAGRLATISCTIPVKTGEDEKLYGSVTASDIAQAAAEQGVELDRHKIELVSPIKELGVFEVPVKLHPEVEANLKVWIVEE